MKTMTVQLEDEQLERIEEIGRRLGITSVEVIQRAIDEYFRDPSRSGPEEANPILRIVGLGRSGRSDIATRMEELLDEEWGPWTLRGDDPPTTKQDHLRDSGIDADNHR